MRGETSQDQQGQQDTLDAAIEREFWKGFDK